MFGRGLKIVRKKRGLTQTKLSEKTGIGRPYLSLIENDKKTPSFATVKKFADALQVPPAIIGYYGITKDEVHKSKREVYDLLAPSIEDLLNKILFEKHDFDS